jgi:Reverse transcriptase (RNA-dependent DNA polymerase)
VLKCDIEHFFPSMDHSVLFACFERLIADGRALWLIRQVLDSGAGVHRTECEPVYFPGDDLFAALRPRGLPIGNLTSQFWANVYLNGFDQFVKRQLKCQAYLRYVDDFLLFHNDKEQLWEWREALIENLARLRLTIHEHQAQAYPAYTGIPFLGFRIFTDHRRVKRRKVVQYRRRLRKILAGVAENPAEFPKLDRSVQGWINHVRYADSWGLRRSMLDFSIPGR